MRSNRGVGVLSTLAVVAVGIAAIGWVAFAGERSEGRRKALMQKLVGMGIVPDHRLINDVRRALRNATARSDLIIVEIHGGEIVLRGSVSKTELRSVLAAVYSVPSVRGLVDRLEISS